MDSLVFGVATITDSGRHWVQQLVFGRVGYTVSLVLDSIIIFKEWGLATYVTYTLLHSDVMM